MRSSPAICVCKSWTRNAENTSLFFLMASVKAFSTSMLAADIPSSVAWLMMRKVSSNMPSSISLSGSISFL
ncbi:MAG TPA: hypothetical protein PKW49_04145 [Paludibacteraceae bacterium]|nr:hypothetical protein [Paludibacteraceae bacterium]